MRTSLLVNIYVNKRWKIEEREGERETMINEGGETNLEKTEISNKCENVITVNICINKTWKIGERKGERVTMINGGGSINLEK